MINLRLWLVLVGGGAWLALLFYELRRGGGAREQSSKLSRRHEPQIYPDDLTDQQSVDGWSDMLHHAVTQSTDAEANHPHEGSFSVDDALNPVVFYVVTKERNWVDLQRLQILLRSEGLEIGDDGIFYYYGDKGAGENILYSVADMLEPGRLDAPRYNWRSVGIICCMYPRSDFSWNHTALDAMLATIRRTAQVLDAEILDQTRHQLLPTYIDKIRQRWFASTL